MFLLIQTNGVKNTDNINNDINALNTWPMNDISTLTYTCIMPVPCCA